MKIANIIASAALAIMPVQAMASDWWLISIGGDKPHRSLVFGDKESIQSGVGNTIRMWKQTFYEGPSDGVRTDKILEEIDCANRSMKLISWIDYGFRGEVLHSGTPNYYASSPMMIAPDTLGEAQIKFACGYSSSAIHIGALNDLDTDGVRFLGYIDAPTK